MIFDIMLTAAMRDRAAEFLQALCNGAAVCGVDARIINGYSPRSGSVLVLYGLGGHDRFQYARRHMDSGGRLLAWDAGYWERHADDRKFRVAIDGFHSPQYVMRGPSPGSWRWEQSGLRINDLHNAAGPIVLVGNGPKACAVGASGWLISKLREIRAAHPKRKVLYRPKPNRPMEHGAKLCDGILDNHKIERALHGASLVICRHSNVAVDACRNGIPVICDDGAAASIYPSQLADEKKQPSAEERLEFLHRVAWWQWSPVEAERGEPWPWLIRTLELN